MMLFQGIKFLFSQDGCLAILLLIVVVAISGCGSGEVPVPDCEEWYCERSGITLKIKNGHAHFIDKEGGVVAILAVTLIRSDAVWKTKDGDIVISKVGEEMYVGMEDSDDDNVAGIYTPASERDNYILPIDLDGKNHIDINVKIVPGEKPKVTVKDNSDQLASTEDSDE